MKKSTINTVYAILTNATVTDEAKAAALADITNDMAKNEAKAQANRDLYAAAHDVVMEYLTSDPMTAKDIYAAVVNDLPEDFTASKLQYALREMWANEVVRDASRSPVLYSKKA